MSTRNPSDARERTKPVFGESDGGHLAMTKIVATVGPSSAAEPTLVELSRRGVDVFRINMAHGDRDGHEATLAAIRAVALRVDRPLAVLVDLSGPKIRLGEIAGGVVECSIGDVFHFVRGESTNEPRSLTSTYAGLVDELEKGDRILLADGTVGMEVQTAENDLLECRVFRPGMLRSRQGINLPNADLKTPALGPKDRDDAVWAAGLEIDFMGLSFVRSASEVDQLKSLLAEHDSQAAVIAKIEKPEALANLESIVAAADGVMIARGDLGVEIDIARVPVVQKQIIAVAHRFGKPVITATQMLDSMQHVSTPTRAEVSDVANAILDGSDACMLSGETAIGKYPREAVQIMNRVALETETVMTLRPATPEAEELPSGLRPVTQEVVRAAASLAASLPAKLLVVASHSGATALALSQQRPSVPTLGVSDSEETLRRMCLYWGVIPATGCPLDDWMQILQFAAQWGLDRDLLSLGDRFILVAGTGLPADGHNLLLVHEVA